MSQPDHLSLATLVSEVAAGRVDRRAFLTSAGTLGLSAALAGAVYEAGLGASLAAPARGRAIRSVSFQDGGKTLVLGITQTTVQLDPSIAGSNGYGDIIPINENLYEGLTRYKNGTAEIEPALA